MHYWLVKSDPETYGWKEFQKVKKEMWDGVRNYQARNNLRAMKEGDQVLFYHSGKDKCVKGTAEVVREAYQDPTTQDEAWVAVDIKPQNEFTHPVSLKDIKAESLLENMALVRNSRLSVMPVLKKEYDKVVKMGS